MPLKLINPLLTAVMIQGQGGLLAGPQSGRLSRKHQRENMQRTFSPPDSTQTALTHRRRKTADGLKTL
jgi:hypothetical protein